MEAGAPEPGFGLSRTLARWSPRQSNCPGGCAPMPSVPGLDWRQRAHSPRSCSVLLFRTARRCLLPIVIVFAAMAAPAGHGIAVANMDPAVQPGNDFFQYCNGGWIARTAIPPDRAAVEVFGELADRSDRQTSAIIARVAKSNPAPGSEARKIADLYNSVLDLKAIDTRGMAPLHAQLAAIAAIHSRDDLARALGLTLRADVDALNDTNFHTPSLFGLWTAPGFHDD